MSGMALWHLEFGVRHGILAFGCLGQESAMLLIVTNRYCAAFSNHPNLVLLVKDEVVS